MVIFNSYFDITRGYLLYHNSAQLYLSLFLPCLGFTGHHRCRSFKASWLATTSVIKWCQAHWGTKTLVIGNWKSMGNALNKAIFHGNGVGELPLHSATPMTPMWSFMIFIFFPLKMAHLQMRYDDIYRLKIMHKSPWLRKKKLRWLNPPWNHDKMPDSCRQKPSFQWFTYVEKPSLSIFCMSCLGGVQHRSSYIHRGLQGFYLFTICSMFSKLVGMKLHDGQ